MNRKCKSCGCLIDSAFRCAPCRAVRIAAQVAASKRKMRADPVSLARERETSKLHMRRLRAARRAEREAWRNRPMVDAERLAIVAAAGPILAVLEANL